MPAPAIRPGELRRAFELPAPPTLGLEEEAMLLEPGTLDLAPRAPELLAALGDDSRFKLEMPASQMEIVLEPVRRAGEAADVLIDARRRLSAAASPLRLAAAGAHPFASAEGELNRGERYERLAARFGSRARRQLVCALQVHVAIRGADRALAVHDALRPHLPALAALAASAPFYQGRDSGLASARPGICSLLPRQGVPPALGSWEAFGDMLNRLGDRQGDRVLEGWWWELRLNPAFGTIEVRVPDAQPTVRRATAVAATIHCLAVWLGQRHDAGELGAPVPSRHIAENRAAAARGGLDALLTDHSTGAGAPARERLEVLLELLLPTAHALGCSAELGRARGMLADDEPALQREVAADRGLHGLIAWLADRYLEPARTPCRGSPASRPGRRLPW